MSSDATAMPGSEPGKATHAEFASVQPASAAMPSEGLSEERLVGLTTKAMRAFEPLSSALRYREANKWHTCDVMGMRAAVRVIWSEFAPILAEKEREKEAAIQVAEMNATAGAFWAERGKTAEARALAAEAALASKDEQLLIALAALKKIDEGCAAAIRAQGE